LPKKDIYLKIVMNFEETANIYQVYIFCEKAILKFLSLQGVSLYKWKDNILSEIKVLTTILIKYLN